MNTKKIMITYLSIFFLISLLTIYSAELIVGSSYLVVKQIIWYTIGALLICLIYYIGNKFIIKHIFSLYVIFNILLLLLLFFGREVNNAKCWFSFYGFTFQPSEFMKIILIIYISKICSKSNKNLNFKKEFKLILKVFLVTLIPSILTFLEPDTGVVIIYFIIMLSILFVYGIRYRWYFFLILFCVLGIAIILSIYFTSKDLFIKILGTKFFLRIDRILDWSNKSGYQLNNGMVSIASAGLFGHGIFNTPIYFPEAQTDFIFAVFASNFGLFGCIILFLIIFSFDIYLCNLAIKTNKNVNKYIITGTVGMLIYQQFQNIGMTYGLLPITGITLPFISYGGSSLLSYMIIMGLIFGANKKSLN